MKPPKTADGASISYGDTVYYLFHYYDGAARYPEPQVLSLKITEKNLTLKGGVWAMERPESHNYLFPQDVYRDRRRVVTLVRQYWKDRIKELRVKLKVWNDDPKVRRMYKEIKDGVQADQA